MAKRLLCVLLSVLMVVAMLPTGVFATDTTVWTGTIASEGVTITADYGWHCIVTYSAADGGDDISADISGARTALANNGAVLKIVTTGSYLSGVVAQGDSGSGTASVSAYGNGDSSYTNLVTADALETAYGNLLSDTYKLYVTNYSGSDAVITSITVYVPDEVVVSTETLATLDIANYSSTDWLTVASTYEDTDYVSSSDFNTFLGYLNDEGTKLVVTVDSSNYWAQAGINPSCYVNSNGGSISLSDYESGKFAISYDASGDYVFTIDGPTIYNAIQTAGYGQLISQGGVIRSAKVVKVTTASASSDAKFHTRTLTLGGKIGINYYVDFTDVDEADRSDYSVVFTVDGADTTVTYATASATTGNYSNGNTVMFTCEVPCWKMGTYVTAVLKNGDTEVQSDTYSIANYAADMGSGNVSSSFDTLLGAMLTYGHYAYTYMGQGTEVSYSDVSSVTVDTLSSYAVGTELDGEIILASLVLDETCQISFTLGEGYTMTINGEDANVITDILVQDWDKTFEIVVYNSEKKQVYSFNYSVLSYAYAVVKAGDSTNTHYNLVKAMYLYNQAVDAYFS